jgi:hypothetical protein
MLHVFVTRTWAELIQLMRERSSGPSHVDVGGGAAHGADEWIRTSVWMIKELGAGYRERMALRSVNQRFLPLDHASQGIVRRKPRPKIG